MVCRCDGIMDFCFDSVIGKVGSEAVSFGVFNGEDMIYTNCIFGCLYDFESFLKVCFIDACEVLFMFG